MSREPFKTYETIVPSDTIFYLFTDGIIDQANEQNKKFTKKRLIEFIESIAEKTITEQKKNIDKEVNDWKNNNIQFDDITFIALRLK